MPADTIILIDEFHELFFNQLAVVVNGKFVSVVLKLKAAAKVIGVSATFRGEAGVDKITTILNARFIKSPFNLIEKELQLKVFGETVDIMTKSILLATEKAKQMPVIIFCMNPQEYKRLLPESKVFVGNDVGELMAILESLRGSSNAIVITTSKDSKGVDFIFAVPQAFVIHTELPTSMVHFKQDSGRSARGNDLPIIGALFTNKPYTTI